MATVKIDRAKFKLIKSVEAKFDKNKTSNFNKNRTVTLKI